MWRQQEEGAIVPKWNTHSVVFFSILVKPIVLCRSSKQGADTTRGLAWDQHHWNSCIQFKIFRCLLVITSVAVIFPNLNKRYLKGPFIRIFRTHIPWTVAFSFIEHENDKKTSSWKGVRKGYHLSMESIREGYLFCQKRCIKGYGVGLRRAVSPY